MSNLHIPLTHQALAKKYEERTLQEHKILTNAIAPFFPILSDKKIKLITFFLELKEANSQINPQCYSSNSFLIIFSASSNPEQFSSKIQKITKQVILSVGQFGAVLDYEKYLNADLLGESSIQKQLSFWASSQYFCSMPKKKFLELIRLAKVLVFIQNQTVYSQGQLVTQKESGSGVYIIRSGEFGSYRNDGKEIEVSHYGGGHLFGGLELTCNNGRGTEFRVTTVRCKTSSSIVYKFSQSIFKQYILHYCENALNQRQNKLLKFIPARKDLLQKSKSISYSQAFKQSKIMKSPEASGLLSIRTTSKVFRQPQLEQTQRRVFPTIRLQQIRQTATTSFYKSTLRQSQRIQSEGLRRSTYMSLKKDGPLKNYPLPIQRCNFLTSQFKDIDKLFQKPATLLIETQPQRLPAGKIQKGVWKRDMISSFYRQSMYNSLKKAE